MLVRSWNVFHGNSMPPSRRSHLREMVALATADGPDVLCLQEVPVWALRQLGVWSGMATFPCVARPSHRPAALAAWLTRLDNGLFRSRLAGQANAILVARRHHASPLGARQVSDPGRERRVAHAVRVEDLGVVVTLHLTNAPGSLPIQREELRRAEALVSSVALPGEPRVIAGDLNLRGPSLPGYDGGGGAGIDHVLVAGTIAAPLAVWPRERRMQNGVVLSDHAPVEREVG